jgi:arylsulfatase
MSGAFRGVVSLDIRDSTPDWAPFSHSVTPHPLLNDAE